MSETEKKPMHPVRQQLMRLGGTITMVMAGVGLSPEEVASHNGVTAEKMVGIMTGSAEGVTVAELHKVTSDLGVNLVIGVNVPQAQPTRPPFRPPVPPQAQPTPGAAHESGEHA